MCKKTLVIICLLALFLCCSFANAAEFPENDEIEKILKSNFAPNSHVIYTEVPRGIIISVDGDYIFKGDSPKLLLTALPILDKIAQAVIQVSNDLVIEDHTSSLCKCYADIELSMQRSNNIVTYLTRYRKVPLDRVFSMGYGYAMPFKNTLVAQGKMFERRVDFVIIHYEARR